MNSSFLRNLVEGCHSFFNLFKGGISKKKFKKPFFKPLSSTGLDIFDAKNPGWVSKTSLSLRQNKISHGLKENTIKDRFYTQIFLRF